ncbi:amphi-Trp domain-containing protein [Thalassovita taeanensis]|uniref:Amphi-Trp domain-containing protein n=1 Tax=Thalassovita taeanensis TaxID=657014 RepID=A0A1H8ZER1_9RHOB|nr:amphi-Trp domain-containing protein [Thalassovita taeanensis]SEP62863.1 amphi-Trp domain-containing protein [Thalassovita taeanensis]
MAKETTRFTHESLHDAKTIKSLLAALTKGFSKGELTLSDEQDELVLHPSGLMTVRIKAEREDGQCKVNLRVSWTDQPSQSIAKGTPKIVS